MVHHDSSMEERVEVVCTDAEEWGVVVELVVVDVVIILL